jgi:hypothetical protein
MDTPTGMTWLAGDVVRLRGQSQGVRRRPHGGQRSVPPLTMRALAAALYAAVLTACGANATGLDGTPPSAPPEMTGRYAVTGTGTAEVIYHDGFETATKTVQLPWTQEVPVKSEISIARLNVLVIVKGHRDVSCRITVEGLEVAKEHVPQTLDGFRTVRCNASR